MSKRSSAQVGAIISAAISLIAFLYKFSLGVLTASIILMVASGSTLIVFFCKVLFIKNINSTRYRKKVAYFIMMILALSFGVLFLLFAVLKIGGIDTSRSNNFTGWLSYLFMAFVILMFLLSIINLKGALEKDDIMVIGLKEMTFVSALADAVIIEEFLYKTILYSLNIPFLSIVNNYFPLLVAVFMLSIPFFMFRRYREYAI